MSTTEPVALTAIVAVGPGRLLGRADGTLPWHIREDLAHFRQVTTGHTLIVGRRTADTLPALPGRRLVIVTTRPAPPQPPGEDGTAYAASPARGFELAGRTDPEPMLIGGGQLYAALWDQITALWWTDIDLPGIDARDGDVTLPAACTTAGFDETSTVTPAPGVTIRRFHRW